MNKSDVRVAFMASDKATLREVISNGIKARRLKVGMTQDEVATAAQKFNFPWQTPTISAIEHGRRDLSIEDLVVLCAILETTFADLLPTAKESVQLRDGVFVQLRRLREALLGGRPLDVDALPLDFLWLVGIREVDRNTAGRLNLSPEAVQELAQQLWGRSLSDERDLRAGPKASAQERGWVTRKLLQELEDSKRSRSKRAGR